MKKLFTILALLAFLVVPAASMAMVQTSDADLAAITGQSGVDLDITGVNIALGLGTLTWGDYDGVGGTLANAGFINVVFYQVPMHVAIGEVKMSVDVATVSGKTAVVLGISIPSPITIDAIVADVVLDSNNGAVVDYKSAQGYSKAQPGAYTDAGCYIVPGNTSLGLLNTSTLGVFGISGISLQITTPLTVTISAH
jgi:hypothetical protein